MVCEAAIESEPALLLVVVATAWRACWATSASWLAKGSNA